MNLDIIIRKLKELRAEGKSLEDFEYLLHHIESTEGEEEIHHCFLYDHLGNLFKHGHLVIKDGSAEIDGQSIDDGTYHIITGLEESQDVCWSDAQAEENGIKPKDMIAGMTFEQKAEAW